MNANLPLQMSVIKDWINDAKLQLASVGIPSASLDAEIILANALDRDRTYLHAHPEQQIDISQLKVADNNLKLRINRIPIAYIIGKKEFYGRQFIVTDATLIPRPESETIIELLPSILKTMPKNQLIKLVDVGTGSGCLGITAKLEFPNLDVTLSDISNDALRIATENANRLSANVRIIQSDLLQNYDLKPSIIIANLPYVDKTWDRSPETNFEPALALFAENNGLDIIEKLIIQASAILVTNGVLVLEADPVQHDSIIDFAKQYSLVIEQQSGYITVFRLAK